MSTYPETVDQDDRLLDSLLYREEVEEYDPDEEADDPCVDDGLGDY